MKTYLWDFFGPAGEMTAQHFLKHLNEFLLTHEITSCEVGIGSQQPKHTEVWCISPEAHQQDIIQALKPKRMLEGEVRSSL